VYNYFCFHPQRILFGLMYTIVPILPTTKKGQHMKIYLNIYKTIIDIFVKKQCSSSNNDVKEINKHNCCLKFHNFINSNAYLASLLHM
jgi:hypothetical protein